MVVAERLRESIQNTSFHTNMQHTISVGVATMRADDTPHTLVARADDALYHAKEIGRNRVC